MRRLLLVALVALPQAQEGLPAADRDALAAATAWVRMEAGAKRTGAAGFLVARDGEDGVLVSTSKVVDTLVKERVVSVTFAPGKPSTFTATAEVLAVDAEFDLSVLKVRAKNLPAPVKPAAAGPAREAMPVYYLGFPQVGDPSGEPSKEPVFGRAAVSSLGSDGFGGLDEFVLEGSSMPSAGGGPVVDAAGALLGLARASVPGQKTLSVTAARWIVADLAGRVPHPRLVEKSLKDGILSLSMESRPVDPGRKLKACSLLAATRDQAPDPKPDAAGTWGPAAAGMASHPFKLEGDRATGEVVLKSSSAQDVEYLLQVRSEYSDGRVHCSAPRVFVAGFGRKAGAPAAATDDWLGRPEDWKRWRESAGRGQEASEALAADRREVGGFKVATCAVVKGTQYSSLNPDQVVLLDESRLALLDYPIGLKIVTFPDFKVIKKLPLPRRRGFLRPTKDGLLLVHQPDGDIAAQTWDIWILDRDSLEPKKKYVESASLGRVISSPHHTYAICVGERNDRILDLKTGKITPLYPPGKDPFAKVKRHDSSRSKGTMTSYALAADGKYLFTMESGSLVRYAMKSDGPVPEEVSDSMKGPSKVPVLSPDGRYVSIAYSADSHRAQSGKGATLVFKLQDLKAPVLTIPEAEVIAFDRDGKRLIALLPEGEVGIYKPDGTKVLGEYVLNKGEQGVALPVPGGAAALLLNGNLLVHLEFPAP